MHADSDAVSGGIRDSARPLATLDPRAPLTDLEPLRDIVGNAAVVGLGRTTHGAHEMSVLSHRILRFLVEHLGFRSLAVEENWTKGIEYDEYLRTGDGNLQALLDDAQEHLRNEEFLDVLRWMREHNERNPADPTRFVGVDVSGLGPVAFDAVIDYVRRAAPDRLDEVQSHYAGLRPSGGIAEHTDWYRSQPDKQPLIADARRARDIVEGLPVADGHATALRHARVIAAFGEYHAIDSMTSMAYLERCLADNTVWWHAHTGHKIVYWSGTHSAVGHARTVSFAPAPPKTSRNAGSYLREHLGADYVSVGLTFHHGSLDLGGPPQAVPAPTAGRADSVLGGAGLDTYLLELHHGLQDSLRAWLDAPATLRLIGPGYDPRDDANQHMSGGSLADWYDVVIHCRLVTPTRPREPA